MLPGTITSLAQHVIDRLTVHNISKDPLGWDGNTTISMESDFLEYLTRIIDLNKKCAVVIDSISNLILHRGASYTCRVLHKCSTLQRQKDVETSPVIALIHQDVHDETAMNMICHTASTVIDLHPPQSQDYSGSCHILHKKSSGKIIKITEQYKINRSYDDIINVEEIKQQFGLIDKPQETVADPAANLTFNLSLSEKEKLARSKVVLPYIQKPERSDVGVSSAGSGKIFYQPDEADDFDEEDPDDDLDI
ncbi:hypothetical protein LSH36_84g10035 [Paralvinella palmiformis]|uniref:Elongator complex protein 5 n=1 Tax=Paralvinella palmiformis TaxID=53620 RepID=A0AAD9K1L2_9ANNE|nr:hypothetical protein LSH36_84g10035 [Paralvinella palmiformis]